MEVKLKHRIVGLLVVAGLAVIIIPILFTTNSSHSTTPKLATRIPTPPPIPSTQLDLPAKPTTINLTEKSDTALGQQQQTTNNGLEQATKSLANNSQPTTGQQAVTTATKTVMATSTADATAKQPTLSKPVKQPVAVHESAVSSSVKPKQVQATKSATTHSTPTLPTAKAFTVQLAAFSDVDNANKLVKKLRAAGFTAYVKTSAVDDKKVTRVLVGPVTKKTKAEQLAQELQAKFKLKGMVINYQV